MGLTFGDSKIETNYIRGGDNFIFRADQENGLILFTEDVSNNSFWAEQGVLADDILQEVNGTMVTMQNAQGVLGEVYQWKPDQDVEIKLSRNGEDVFIKTKLVKTYTTTKNLSEDDNASTAQIQLRNAWLNLPQTEN